MAKVNKEEEARREGMAYALKLAKEKGIEALENECRFRNATRLPVAISRKARENNMAEVYRCDRCGRYYDENKKVESKGSVSGGIITGIITTSNNDRDEWFDLCDDCITAFENFMAGKEVRNLEFIRKNDTDVRC